MFDVFEKAPSVKPWRLSLYKERIIDTNGVKKQSSGQHLDRPPVYFGCLTLVPSYIIFTTQI